LSQPGSQTKSKELKLVTKQVVTPDSVKEDKRKLQLLYLISNFDGISEKALLYAISELKNRGLDLGYNIVTLGNNVTSPQVKDDLTALLYLGLLEIDQAKTRRRGLQEPADFVDSGIKGKDKGDRRGTEAEIQEERKRILNS
jgi:hypothetical protein